jgi:protein phosphatase
VAIEACGRSDPGRIREQNEDSFVVSNLHRTMVVEQSSLEFDDGHALQGEVLATLLLVADGMGGESAGDRASRLAVETYVDYVLNEMPWFYHLDERHGGDLVTVLRDGVARCEAKIQAYQQADPERGRMGTTLTLAWVLWPNLYVVHAGDSRCYLLRKGELKQLTKDHTVAQLMADQGTATPRDSEQYGHVLWNAVGADAATPVKPQVGKHELQFGDYLLLCSDGLHGMVNEERIRQLLLAPSSAPEAAQQLVQAALDGGGEDNVTVVVARCQARGTFDEETTMEHPFSDDEEPTMMT